MTRYGYVIRTGGDADIARALASGVKAATPALSAAQRQTVQTELRRRPALVDNVALHRGRTPADWQGMICDAEMFYGEALYYPSRWARLTDRLQVVWALLVWLFSARERR